MRKVLFSVGLAFCVLLLPAAQAEVRLPAVISNNMVLQREAPVPIWGWAEAGEEVTVTIAGQSKSVQADGDGKWAIKLDALAVGGPHQMTVAGKNTITLEGILVGEAWVCSGQSNMAWTVSRAKNAQEEIAAAQYPKIRMFTVKRSPKPEPQSECQGTWQVCSPETAGRFSATAYYFGRSLHQALKIPIGLINTSVGGTRIEAWTSRRAMMKLEYGRNDLKAFDARAAKHDPEAAKQRNEKAMERWKQAAAKWREAKKAGKAKGRPPRRPRLRRAPGENQNDACALYNGMIAPLIPYAVRGAIWYQGEANTRNAEVAYEYRNLLPNMITNWREDWGQGI